MSNFFFGLTLNTQALTAEQNYIALPGKPSPEPQQLGAPAASGFDPGVDPVALNPQPLPPEEGGINAALLASLPASFLDTVALNPQPLPPAEIADTLSLVALNPQPLPPAEIGAAALSWVALNPQPLPPAEIGRNALSLVALNPQPLPPQESPSTMNLPVSLPSGLRLPSPAELLYKANVIGTVTDGQQSGPELQRNELWRDVARPAEQISFGGTLRERETLQNLIDDAVHGANPWGRDRVMPWNPSDYVGGVGSYPIEGDRLRPPLFVKGAGDLDEVSINDIDQGQLGDCYFLAALATVAKQDPQRIKDMVTDNGDGTYTVHFKDRAVTVNADFPGGVSGDGHAAGADGTPQKTREIWPLVFEKAFGVYLDAVDPYGQLAEADTPMVALEALTGRPVEFSSSSNKSLDELYGDLLAGKSIVWFSGDVYPAKHFFAVEDVFRDPEGKEWVQLYNPWGSHDWVPLEFVQGHQMYTA